MRQNKRANTDTNQLAQLTDKCPPSPLKMSHTGEAFFVLGSRVPIEGIIFESRPLR